MSGLEYNFPLEERFKVAENTMAFVFKSSDFTFRAGQYLEVILENMLYPDERGNERHFSIASSPGDKNILMITTRVGGERPLSGFKRTLTEISLGSLVKIKGPRGNFTLHENQAKKAVFLAGGIGITPCRSILKDAAERKLLHQMTLIYSNRNPGSAAFLEDLKKWERENPNFRLFAPMTDTEGYVDADYIKNKIGDLSDTIFYVVGPPAMVQGLTKVLEEIGVSRDEMRFEEFTGY